MSATGLLDNFYDGVSSLSNSLAYLPYTATYSIFANSSARRNYKEYSNQFSDKSADFAMQVVAQHNGSNYAAGLCILLSPVLLPLTIATFVLAMAIKLVSTISQLITYPIASAVDACFSPSSK
ncbi:hypothetical protein [Legionella sp. W05-934-2]|jgi:hypothetical protein|uniref:hypothetical protein n=1 Tax=Legionella sp. W05-934-2 TaxID=1198649 RepID=UPI003463375C